MRTLSRRRAAIAGHSTGIGWYNAGAPPPPLRARTNALTCTRTSTRMHLRSDVLASRVLVTHPRHQLLRREDVAKVLGHVVPERSAYHTHTHTHTHTHVRHTHAQRTQSTLTTHHTLNTHTIISTLNTHSKHATTCLLYTSPSPRDRG